MEKLQAMKTVTELLNDSGKKKKASRESQEMKLSSSQLCSSTSCRCFYCNKIFAHPRYVVKHMWRRHADKLVSLHEQLKRQKDENYSQATVPKTGTHNVENEITTFCEVFKRLQLEIVQLLSRVEQERVLGAHMFSTGNAEVGAQQTCHHRTSSSEFVQSKEFVDLKEKYVILDAAIQGLENKYKHLMETVKQAVSLKEAVAENNLHNQQLCKEVTAYKNEISTLKIIMDDNLTSLKAEVFHEMRKKNLELEKNISKLKDAHAAEIQNICSMFQNHCTKLSSLQNAAVEEKLEQHLQHYLKKVLQKPDSGSAKKCGSRALAPKHFSKKTLVSKATEPKTPISKATNPRNFIQSSIGLPQLKRIKAILATNPNALNTLCEDASNLVDAKMQSLGLSCVKKRMTSVEFANKSKLVKTEAKHLHSKYADFPFIHKEIEKQITRKVQLLLVDPCIGNKRHSVSKSFLNQPSVTKRSLCEKNVESVHSISESSNHEKNAKSQCSTEFVVTNCEKSLDDPEHASVGSDDKCNSRTVSSDGKEVSRSSVEECLVEGINHSGSNVSISRMRHRLRKNKGDTVRCLNLHSNQGQNSESCLTPVFSAQKQTNEWFSKVTHLETNATSPKDSVDGSSLQTADSSDDFDDIIGSSQELESSFRKNFKKIE